MKKRGACPNPFCDGYGAIDVSKRHTGTSWEFDSCAVGPHLPKPDGYLPQLRTDKPRPPRRSQSRRLAWVIATMTVLVVVVTAGFTVGTMLWLCLGKKQAATFVLAGVTVVSCAGIWLILEERER